MLPLPLGTGRFSLGSGFLLHLDGAQVWQVFHLALLGQVVLDVQDGLLSPALGTSRRQAWGKPGQGSTGARQMQESVNARDS